MSDRLSALRATGVLSALDEQLARTLCAIAREPREDVQLAAALVSHQVARGHVCLALPALCRGELTLTQDPDVDPALLAFPELEAWTRALRESPLVGEPAGDTPLVLDGAARLYLRRHFAYERNLAHELLRRMASPALELDEALLAAGLTRLFGDEPGDLQRRAAELALRKPFCVISGGPGTGKTATVVKILALIVEQALHAAAPLPRMHLLAPTGKAASRVRESIQRAKATLDCSDEARAAITEQASTIHRALAYAARTQSRESADVRPELATDLVLVDEASMVDLALMGRLFSAIPEHARVILLGDKHQLASVEAGAVLGDICGADRSTVELANAPLVQLTRSYRYDERSGIGALARAINDGDAARALAILDSESYADVSLCEPRASSKARKGPRPTAALDPRLAQDVLRGFEPSLVARDPAEALARLDGFRVLCAHRRGPHGVETLNAQLARFFVERGLVRAAALHFVHAPILVTENDYRNKLWNGDVGVVIQEAPELPLMAVFAGEGGLRKLSVARLPQHESAFALSIHKSQGSEVDEVAIVLPDEPSPVLTRELLYTAVTRARKRVVIHAPRAQIEAAVTARVARSSGLSDALYGST